MLRFCGHSSIPQPFVVIKIMHHNIASLNTLKRKGRAGDADLIIYAII
ncbi:hypothetical protein DR92_4472 (plasmid) [Brucella anthropi]|nr:hypothetical protein DR92_4472 [Brucella anthropi]